MEKALGCQLLFLRNRALFPDPDLDPDHSKKSIASLRLSEIRSISPVEAIAIVMTLAFGLKQHATVASRLNALDRGDTYDLP